MPELKDTLNDEIPIEEHPLFQAALEQLAQGDEEQATINLNLLAECYPREQSVENLLVQQELRSAFATTERVPVEHSKPVPVLRQILLGLLTFTFICMGIAVFLAAYSHFIASTRESSQQDAAVQRLRRDGQQRLDAGDWNGAREVFQELLTQVPGEPTAQAAMELIVEQEMWDQLYVDAMAAMQRGEWQTAQDLLFQINAYNPEFRDVQYLSETVQTMVVLEARFQEAQALYQAQDLMGAATLLKQIRSQDPEFRRGEVEQSLYQSYVELAMPTVSQASGNADVIREAANYLKEALALQPMNRDLLEEYRLAVDFVAGADAYARGDWVDAVAHWELVYDTRPGYQNGIVEDRLRETYPQASRTLLAQAGGDAHQLRKAIGYLDRALSLSPGDANMIEERRLATEYVAGSLAFSQEDWNGAIVHWGPIYAAQPNYQEGVLEENLRRACLNSAAPENALCPQ